MEQNPACFNDPWTLLFKPVTVVNVVDVAFAVECCWRYVINPC